MVDKAKVQQEAQASRERAAPTLGWVKCPICGEPDMRQVSEGEGCLIECVNIACASNCPGLVKQEWRERAAREIADEIIGAQIIKLVRPNREWYERVLTILNRELKPDSEMK